jgi:hypothetical protein
MTTEDSGAEFSADRKYRYKLWRIWDKSKPKLAFCMLNPSKADESSNDPTVERCVRRAEQLGYGGIYIINIYAYISTDPKELKTVYDPIGPSNDSCIAWVAQECRLVICGWGKHGKANNRGDEVMRLIKFWGMNAHALRINIDGSPSHPL